MIASNIRGFIIESTREPGRFSFRLNRGDPTITPLLRLLKEVGFKAGDAIDISPADATSLAVDHLGREMTGDMVVKHLAAMLGWGNTPPWFVLERDLRAKLERLRALEGGPR